MFVCALSTVILPSGEPNKMVTVFGHVNNVSGTEKILLTR